MQKNEFKYNGIFHILNDTLVAIHKDGFWGIVDFNLKEIVPCIFQGIVSFGEYIQIKKDSKIGLIDKNGTAILDTNYSHIRVYSDLIVVKKGNNYGVTNKHGEFIVLADYDRIDIPVKDGNYAIDKSKPILLYKGENQTKIDLNKIL